MRPRIRCWRKRTPHPRSIPEPNEACLDVQRLDGSGHRPLGLAQLRQNVRVVEDGRDQIVTDDHFSKIMASCSTSIPRTWAAIHAAGRGNQACQAVGILVGNCLWLYAEAPPWKSAA